MRTAGRPRMRLTQKQKEQREARRREQIRRSKQLQRRYLIIRRLCVCCRKGMDRAGIKCRSCSIDHGRKSAERRRFRIEHGLCVTCAVELTPENSCGRLRRKCTACAKIAADQSQKRTEERRKAGLCTRCKARLPETVLNDYRKRLSDWSLGLAVAKPVYPQCERCALADRKK